MRNTVAGQVKTIRNTGFTMVEVAIAMFILGVFLLPLMQHFVHTRRVSLAARDAVIVNSFQTSCIGELRMVAYDELSAMQGQAFFNVLNKYSGARIVNNLNIESCIEINTCSDTQMLMIDVNSEFRFPGSPEGQVKRKVTMRGYVFPKL